MEFLEKKKGLSGMGFIQSYGYSSNRAKAFTAAGEEEPERARAAAAAAADAECLLLLLVLVVRGLMVALVFK